MIGAAVLLAAALITFLPEHLASQLGGTPQAWEVVATGVQALLLWLWVATTAPRALHVPPAAAPHTTVRAVRAVAAWMAFGALQQAGCRLLMPMTHAPRLAPGCTTCETALGTWAGWLDIAAALLATAYVAQALLAGAPRHGR